MYGVVLVMAAIAYTLLQFVIVTRGSRPGLKDALGRDLKAKLSLGAYVVSIPMTFVRRWGSVALFVAVAVTWFIPDRRLALFIESSPSLGECDST